MLQEALEVRLKTWFGRSTVRSLSPGTTFRLTQGPLDALDALYDPNDPDPRFLTTRAVHAGINNLPKHISAQVAQRVLDGGFEHSGAGLHQHASGHGHNASAAVAPHSLFALTVDHRPSAPRRCTPRTLT